MLLIMSQNGKLLYLLPFFEDPYGHSSKTIILVKFCSCIKRLRIWKKLCVDKSMHSFCPKVIIFQSTFILVAFRITI